MQITGQMTLKVYNYCNVARLTAMRARTLLGARRGAKNFLSIFDSTGWRYRLGVRTSDSQSGNPGSIPGTATNSFSLPFSDPVRSQCGCGRKCSRRVVRDRHGHTFIDRARTRFSTPVRCGGGSQKNKPTYLSFFCFFS